MGITQTTRPFNGSKFPVWVVVFRGALGLCLLTKGILFISNTAQIDVMLQSSRLGTSISWLPLFIAWTHLIGGTLITIGMFTRIAAAVQVPILLGAVILVNSYGINQGKAVELTLSIVVLILLVYFAWEGGGPVSVDEYRKNHLI